jgi:leucyl/phenylalanyl-tRNA--protein transferase
MESDDDLVAIGADLEPGTILAAYRQGIFPMPLEQMGDMAWWSPVWRGVLPLSGLRVTRSTRQSAKRFTVSVDMAYDDVVAGCADPTRPGAWIDEQIAGAYRRLHELGWVHSVEVWRGSELVGGLYGVAVAGLFAGESMFHRERDASKVALMALVDLLDDGNPDRVLDVQWATRHLDSLGVVEVSRAAYLGLLNRAMAVELPTAWR